MKKIITYCLLTAYCLASNGQPPNNLIFKGGVNDGFNASSFSQLYTEIRRGGNGDGVNTKNFIQPYTEIRKGGNGDGWNTASFTQPYIELRKGGNGDGWNTASFTQPYIELRKGGNGDGWNTAGFTQAYTEFRKGGAGDGWSSTNRSEAPLPLTILQFTASKKNEQIQVSWNTVNEIKLSHFEVERSANGSQFITMARVNARGGVLTTAYNCVDVQPLAGKNFYRLKTIDADGKFGYTQILLFIFEKQNHFLIYPTPTNSILYVQNNQQTEAAITIADVLGKQLYKGTLHPGINNLNLSTWPNALYFYKINNAQKSVTSGKFIKH